MVTSKRARLMIPGPVDVDDDILTLSSGTLPGLVQAARLAVIDRRDLKMAANELR